MPGAGTAVRLNSPLQAHTWKRLGTDADELFAFNQPADGQIYMEAYDLCAEADGATSGSTVTPAACSDSQNQLFQLEGGLLRRASMASRACVWRSILATAYQPEDPTTSAET